MRIGPIAVIVLLALAAGAGWFVLTQGDAGAPAARPAAQAQAPSGGAVRPAAFDPGAPLPEPLTVTANSINSARFDAAQAGPAGASPAPSATAAENTATASARAPAEPGAAASREGRGPDDAAVEQRTAGTRIDPAVIRAQVLLDRAHFSPGSIDGRNGENFQNALRAFERDRGFDPDGRLDAQVFAALTQADDRPTVRGYQITEEDVRGPFNPQVPTETREMRGLDRIPYRDAAEGLAEKFHMDEDLLRQLNPGTDFARAGQVILVTAVGDEQRLPAEIDRIEVDSDRVQLRAYAGDRLVALFPATIGSSDFPTPQGSMTVTSVAPNPTYTYDPSQLTFGRERNGNEAFTVAAGPNNPVGSTWIDLSEPTYGIHGTPEPDQVGKTASHGCVRLTNWDAAQLGRSVRRGATVTFMGTRTGGTPAAANSRSASASASGATSGSGGSAGRSGSATRR